MFHCRITVKESSAAASITQNMRFCLLYIHYDLYQVCLNDRPSGAVVNTPQLNALSIFLFFPWENSDLPFPRWLGGFFKSAWTFTEQRKYTQKRKTEDRPVEQGIKGQDTERKEFS